MVITAHLFIDNDTLTITVKDNGPGISENDLSKLKGDDKKTETTQSVPATTDENTTTIAEADLEIEEKADNLNSK